MRLHGIDGRVIPGMVYDQRYYSIADGCGRIAKVPYASVKSVRNHDDGMVTIELNDGKVITGEDRGNYMANARVGGQSMGIGKGKGVIGLNDLMNQAFDRMIGKA